MEHVLINLDGETKQIYDTIPNGLKSIIIRKLLKKNRKWIEKTCQALL